ncbi:MAG: hypothetical protein WC558_11315, partial [Patulibacter sp.]
RCRWVHDVAEEVEWRGRNGEPASHRSLTTLIGQGYPKPRGGSSLSPEARVTATELRDLLVRRQQALDPTAEVGNFAHLGESATVAHVADRPGAIAVLDDAGARAIADLKSVRWVTTRRLAAEMVVAGAATERFAQKLFCAVRLAGEQGEPSDEDWKEELQLVRGLVTPAAG